MIRICLTIFALMMIAIPSTAWADAGHDYGLSIRTRIDKVKKYPPSALARGESGRVILAITIDKKGFLIESRIANPSCSQELNAEAMAAVERARPFPSFPPEIDQSEVTFHLPLVFALKPEDAQAVEKKAACNDHEPPPPPPPLLSPPPPSWR